MFLRAEVRALALVRVHAPELLQHVEGWATDWRMVLMPGESLPNVLAKGGTLDSPLWELLAWKGKAPLTETPSFAEDEPFWRRMASLLHRLRRESERRWPGGGIDWHAVLAEIPSPFAPHAEAPLQEPGWIADFAAEANCLRILLRAGLPLHTDVEFWARQWGGQIPRQHDGLTRLREIRESGREAVEDVLSKAAFTAVPLRSWHFALLHVGKALQTGHISPDQILEGLKAVLENGGVPDVLPDALLRKPSLIQLRDFLESRPIPLCEPACFCSVDERVFVPSPEAIRPVAIAGLPEQVPRLGPMVFRRDSNGRQISFVGGELEELFLAWLRRTGRPSPLSLAAFRLENPCLWSLAPGQSALVRDDPLASHGPVILIAMEAAALPDFHSYRFGIRLGWIQDPRPSPPAHMDILPLEEKRLLMATALYLDLDDWNFAPVLELWLAELNDPGFRPAEGDYLDEWAARICEGICIETHPRFIGLVCAWARRMTETRGFPLPRVHLRLRTLSQNVPGFVLPPEMRAYDWLLEEEIPQHERKRRRRYFRTYLEQFAEPGHLAEGLHLRVQARALALRIRHKLPRRADEHQILAKSWLPRFHPRADILHDLANMHSPNDGTLLQALDILGAGACDLLAWLEIRAEIRAYLRGKPHPMPGRDVSLFLSFIRAMDPLEDLPSCLFAEHSASAPIPGHIADALDVLRTPPNLWADSPIFPGTAECPFETLSEHRLHKEWDRHIPKLANGLHLRVCRSNGVRYLLTDPGVLQGLTGRLTWWIPIRPLPETSARDPWNLDISPEHLVDVIREIPGKEAQSVALVLTPGRFAELLQWKCERWMTGDFKLD